MLILGTWSEHTSRILDKGNFFGSLINGINDYRRKYLQCYVHLTIIFIDNIWTIIPIWCRQKIALTTTFIKSKFLISSSNFISLLTLSNWLDRNRFSVLISHLIRTHCDKCARYCTSNINRIFRCNKTIILMPHYHLLFPKALQHLGDSFDSNIFPHSVGIYHRYRQQHTDCKVELKKLHRTTDTEVWNIKHLVLKYELIEWRKFNLDSYLTTHLLKWANLK